MFDINHFINHCTELNQSDNAQKKINDFLKETLKNSSDLINALGKPTVGGIELLHRTDELTIINFVMAPGTELFAHNHNMWAVIGIYNGVEENSFYTRKDESIVKKNQKNITQGNTIMLGENIIHSVRNSETEFSAGIHIYGGDFVGQERSQWDMESFTEAPYDIELAKKAFTDANEKHAQEQSIN